MRFKLDPNLTAMENLFTASRWSSIVVLKRNRFYGVTAQDKAELIQNLTLATVVHFLNFKVCQKRYARFAKDGRPLTFFDNCLSSAWSCAPNVAQPILKRIQLKVNTSNIDDVAFRLSDTDKFPLYMALDEYDKTKEKPVHKLKRASDRAHRYRRMYEDYLAEHDELGLLSEPLSFDRWLSRCGFNADEEMMWALEPESVRHSMLAERLRIMKEKDLTDSERHSRAYMREWQRKRRRRIALEKSADFEKLFGPPPPGHIWKERNGVVGLYKLKE